MRIFRRRKRLIVLLLVFVLALAGLNIPIWASELAPTPAASESTSDTAAGGIAEAEASVAGETVMAEASVNQPTVVTSDSTGVNPEETVLPPTNPPVNPPQEFMPISPASNSDITLSLGLEKTQIPTSETGKDFLVYIGFSAIDTGNSSDFSNFKITIPLPDYLSHTNNITGSSISQSTMLTNMFTITREGSNLVLTLKDKNSIVVGDNYLIPLRLAFTKMVDPNLGNCDPALSYTPTASAAGDFVNTVNATATQSITLQKSDISIFSYVPGGTMLAGDEGFAYSYVYYNKNIVGDALQFKLKITQTKVALVFGDIAADFYDTYDKFDITNVTYNANRTEATVTLVRKDSSRLLLDYSSYDYFYFPIEAVNFTGNPGEIVNATINTKVEPIDPNHDMTCKDWSKNYSVSQRVANEFIWPTGYFTKGGTAVSYYGSFPSGGNGYWPVTPEEEHYYYLALQSNLEPFYKNLSENFTVMKFDDNPLAVTGNAHYFDNTTWKTATIYTNFSKTESTAGALEKDNIQVKVEYATTDNPTLRVIPGFDNRTLTDLTTQFNSVVNIDLAPLASAGNKVSRLVFTYSTVNGQSITPGYTLTSSYGPRITAVFNKATQGDYIVTNRGTFTGDSAHGTSTGSIDVPTYVKALTHTLKSSLYFNTGYDNVIVSGESKEIYVDYLQNRTANNSLEAYDLQSYILLPDFFSFSNISSSFSNVSAFTTVIDGVTYKAYPRTQNMTSSTNVYGRFKLTLNGNPGSGNYKVYLIHTTKDFNNQKVDSTSPNFLDGFSEIFQLDNNFNSTTSATGLTYLPNTFNAGDVALNSQVLAQSLELRVIDGRTVISEKAIIDSNDRVLRSNRVLPGEVFDYRLTIENLSLSDISYLRVADVLPFAGDTQLINGLARGSEFGIEFVSVVSMSPGVTVKYMDNINYSTINNDINNPNSALTTVFNPGATGAAVKGLFFEFNGTLASGGAIEMRIKVKAPAAAAQDKLAINDFAYSGKYTVGIPVSPAQPVKVQTLLAPATPVTLDKSVSQTDPYNLYETADWTVDVNLGNDVMNQTSISLVDPVDPALAIEANSVKLLDGNDVDVSDLANILVVNNEITCVFKLKDGSFYHLVDRDFKLVYKTTLNATMPWADLFEDYGIAGNKIQIPNRAGLLFSNKEIAFDNASITYLQGGIAITKVFENSLLTTNVSTFELYEDTDEDGALTPADTLVDTKSTTDLALAFTYLPIKTYFLKETATEAGYSLIEPLKIELTKDATQSQKVLTVTNLMVPEDPTATKTVSLTEITDWNDDITFSVSYDMGNVANRWNQAKFLDQVDDLLVIDESSITIKDSSDVDVSGRGTLDVTDNLITFTMNKDAVTSDFSYLNNQVYTMTFTCHVNKEADLNLLTAAGEVKNQASLSYGDDDSLDTNEVIVDLPELEEPTIAKSVVTEAGDVDGIMAGFLEPSTWTVTYQMGNYSGLWSRANLVDQVSEFLIIDPSSVDILDSSDVSVLGQGTLDITDNLISFTFTADATTNDFSYLEGNTYRLVYKTTIDKEVDLTALKAEIDANQGIPNVGVLEFGNDWQQSYDLGEISSEPVTVTPPVADPLVTKEVITASGNEEGILKIVTESATWTVNYDMGSMTGIWTRAVLEDQVHPWLIIDETSVDLLDSADQSVLGLGQLDITDNLITFTFNPDQVAGDYTYLANQTYRLVYKTAIDSKVDPKELEDFLTLEGGIPNTGTLLFGNDWMQTSDLGSITSNVVKVSPPGFVSPTVTKSVVSDSGDTAGKLDYTTEVAHWSVAYDMGSLTDLWTRAVIEDQVDDHLVIDEKSIDLRDADGNSVLGLGSLTVKDNLIRFAFNENQQNGFAFLANQKYTLVFSTVISTEGEWEELQQYMKVNAGIPNTASLHYGNDWFTQQGKDTVVSNRVTIIPPLPKEPKVTKAITDASGKNLPHPATFDDKAAKAGYSLTYEMSNYMDYQDRVVLQDQVDKRLQIDAQSVTVTDESGANMLDQGSLSIKDNKISFSFNKQDGSYLYLNQKTITLTFKFQFDQNSLTTEDIHNVAVLEISDKMMTSAKALEYDSNQVTVKLSEKALKNTDVKGASKTGETLNAELWLAGSTLLLAAGALLVWRKKRYSHD